MHLNHIKEMIPLWYKARTSVYLRSPPGMGKTSVISDSIPELSRHFRKNLGIVTLNGAEMNVMDTTGYLMPEERDGLRYSSFIRPYWFITDEGYPLEHYDGGIIFVDEEDKAPIDVKKQIASAKLSKRLGTHRIPEGWLIWGAGNRAEDRSGSSKDLDYQINRRVEINVLPHLQSWKDWAFVHGVHPTFITYADQNPESIFQSSVPEKQGPYPTPRSFTKCAQDMVAFAGEDGKLRTDALVKEHVAGQVGSGVVASLFAYIELGQDMPNFHDIIANPQKTRTPTRADAQMLVAFHLAAKVDEDTMDPACVYMERLPKEFAVAFAKAACRRDGELVNTAAITRWCANNHSLLTTIVDRS